MRPQLISCTVDGKRWCWNVILWTSLLVYGFGHTIKELLHASLTPCKPSLYFKTFNFHQFYLMRFYCGLLLWFLVIASSRTALQLLLFSGILHLFCEVGLTKAVTNNHHCLGCCNLNTAHGYILFLRYHFFLKFFFCFLLTEGLEVECGSALWPPGWRVGYCVALLGIFL